MLVLGILFSISAMSKGKEKVIEIDSGDELEFLPNMLKGPIFDPQILLESVGPSSAKDEPRRMTPKASTSSSDSDSNSTDI